MIFQQFGVSDRCVTWICTDRDGCSPVSNLTRSSRRRVRGRSGPCPPGGIVFVPPQSLSPPAAKAVPLPGGERVRGKSGRFPPRGRGCLPRHTGPSPQSLPRAVPLPPPPGLSLTRPPAVQVPGRSGRCPACNSPDSCKSVSRRADHVLTTR